MIYRFSMIHAFDYRPGDVISVRFGGVLRHYGIVSYGGRVLSNSRVGGGVISQSLEDFAGGRPIKWHGGNDAEAEHVGLARASRRLGHDYHLTGSNCVHLVRNAHGRKPTALQFARGTFEAFRDMRGPKRPRG